MAVIEKRTDEPLDINAQISINVEMIPSFRTLYAVQEGVNDNIILHVTAGLGDIVTAEPTVRHIVNTFKNCKISLATELPEVFAHLEFSQVFDLKKETPPWKDFIIFKSLFEPHHLVSDFLSYIVCNRVDYHSLVMLKGMIPNPKDKCIKMEPTEEAVKLAKHLIQPSKDIVLHPGRSWMTRTMPKEWWNELIQRIVELGYRPVLIGAESKNDRGTVDVDASACLDLRGRLSFMQSVAVLQQCQVFFTNDSAPLHMAASGDAWIGFLSTVNDPGYLYHYRNGGEYGWRMQDFARGGLYQIMNLRPNNPDETFLHEVNFNTLLSWLPDPGVLASWADSKIKEVQ